MKKVVSILMLIVILLSFSGCGKGEETFNITMIEVENLLIDQFVKMKETITNFTYSKKTDVELDNGDKLVTYWVGINEVGLKDYFPDIDISFTLEKLTSKVKRVSLSSQFCKDENQKYTENKIMTICLEVVTNIFKEDKKIYSDLRNLLQTENLNIGDTGIEKEENGIKYFSFIVDDLRWYTLYPVENKK